MYKKVELKNGFVGMEHEVAEGWKKKDKELCYERRKKIFYFL